MAEKESQHFVPRFYFRIYNGDAKWICCLRKEDSRVVPRASVESQCARHLLYGSKRVEDWLSQREGLYASVLRRLTTDVEGGGRPNLTPMQRLVLCEALLVQRARTPHEHRKNEAAFGGMRTYIADTWRSSNGDDQPLPDHLSTAKPQSWALLQQIKFATESAPLLMDLRLVLVVNNSSHPFIFGDAPVVFCNQHLWHVKDHGVLGVRTPGLQVFAPLTPSVVMLMFDASVYSGPACMADVVVTSNEADVWQINMLQLHHSEHYLYFREPRSASYVAGLWSRSRRRCKPLLGRMRVLPPGSRMIDGQPNRGELLQVFDPHLPVRLDLSFLMTNRVSAMDYHIRRRSER